MASNKQPIFVKEPDNWAAEITSANGTNSVELVPAAGADGLRIDKIIITRSGTVDNANDSIITVLIKIGGTEYSFNQDRVGKSIGNGTTTKANSIVLETRDLSPLIALKSGQSIMMKLGATLDANSKVVVLAQGGLF